LEKSVVEESTSEELDKEDEVDVLEERVLVIVRVLKMVDVPVVVAMIVLPVSTLLAIVTPMKADAVGSMERSAVPDESLAPVKAELSVCVLVTSAAENNVFVTVNVGDPLEP